METKEVLNYLFSNPSDKLTSQFQITERGRTIGLAFIAKLMQDGKGEKVERENKRIRGAEGDEEMEDPERKKVRRRMMSLKS